MISIAYVEERQFSFVFYITFSNKIKLRNLDENIKIKFYCDFNNSQKNENISELILINYNCSTDPYENLNITEEDNLIESVELENKDEEKYFDISNINKTMNISQISKNESDFIIFTFYENKTINLANKTSFILEGQTNYKLYQNISIKLSLNHTNDFYMNCIIFKNGSSLFCSFNVSELKVDKSINTTYSIKENEISSDDDKNIFFVGLNKVEFIYEEEIEEKPKRNEKKNNIKLIIIIIIIIIAIIFVGIISFIIAFFIVKKRKKNKELKSKIEDDKSKQSSSSNNKITVNGSSREDIN